MELWDKDYLDLEGPAHITFDRDRLGSFQFVSHRAISQILSWLQGASRLDRLAERTPTLRTAMVVARCQRTLIMAIVGLGAGAVGAAQVPGRVSRTAHPPLVAADSVRNVLVLAGRAVVASVLATGSDSAPVCVSFAEGRERYRATEAERRMLSDGRVAVLDATDCPETYASMFTLVDSLGRPIERRPPGYVDPRYVELMLPVQWSMYSVIVDVRVQHGMSTDTYQCLRRRTATNQPFSCRAIRHAVS